MKKNYFLRAAVLLLALCTLTVSIFVTTGTMAKYIASAESAEVTARAAKFSVTVGGTEIAQASGAVFKLPFATFNPFNTIYDTRTDSTVLDNTASVGVGGYPAISDGGGDWQTEGQISLTAAGNGLPSSTDGTLAEYYTPTGGSKVTGTGKKIVAPGTKGRLGATGAKLTIKNESEVTIRVSVVPTFTSNISPLKFYNNYVKAGDSVESPEELTSGTAIVLEAGSLANVTWKVLATGAAYDILLDKLTWTWPIGTQASDDVTDTGIGVGANGTASDGTTPNTIANLKDVSITFSVYAEQVD